MPSKRDNSNFYEYYSHNIKEIRCAFYIICIPPAGIAGGGYKPPPAYGGRGAGGRFPAARRAPPGPGRHAPARRRAPPYKPGRLRALEKALGASRALSALCLVGSAAVFIAQPSHGQALARYIIIHYLVRVLYIVRYLEIKFRAPGKPYGRTGNFHK